MSLGHQVSCGVRRAKVTACCPVPLPISRMSPPCAFKNLAIADQIAS